MVAFKRLTAAEIDAYLASGEWRRQGRRLRHPGPRRRLRRGRYGSYSNVVGLPLFETARLLEGRGWRPVA